MIYIDYSRTSHDNFIERDIKHSLTIKEDNLEILLAKIDSLEDKIVNEFGFSRAYDYAIYEDLIKCMNYYADSMQLSTKPPSSIQTTANEAIIKPTKNR